MKSYYVMNDNILKKVLSILHILRLKQLIFKFNPSYFASNLKRKTNRSGAPQADLIQPIRKSRTRKN